MAPSVKLTADELDRALSFLEQRGASFAFPQPLELAAIRASWDKVRPALEATEMLSRDPHPIMRMTAPKQRALIRPVHLIDPIDTILYTGLVFRLAPAIEARRAEYQDERVYSYHFDATASAGKVLVSDWETHREQLAARCDRFAYIGTTDIVDFFPHVYLHRLKNGLDALSGSKLAVAALMRMVEGWSAGTSYGIPTGPHASNFLAEALLVEVDEYLLSCDVEFSRWVDDYFIFGDSEEDVIAGLFRLGERLDQTQGLSLNSAKTRLQKTDSYAEGVLRRVDPVEEWRQAIVDNILDGLSWYADELDIDELTDEQLEAIDAVDARVMLEEALEADLVDLKTVRFILSFLAAFKRPELADLVIDNLPRLSPLSEGVARFLDAVADGDDVNQVSVGTRIIDYIANGVFVPEFQMMWLLDPFTKSAGWNNLTALRKIAREARSALVRRQAILGLLQSEDRSAILDAKSALDDARDWERRAILFACAGLPKDERLAIANQAGGTGGQWDAGNCLEKAVLAYMKADGGA
ncbi:MAG: RNA-directed DNA polymerase [Actinobacteria bacterium]|nr:MAG: RNA-directed DNA polymerase [Actinomycetota bacterium]